MGQQLLFPWFVGRKHLKTEQIYTILQRKEHYVIKWEANI